MSGQVTISSRQSWHNIILEDYKRRKPPKRLTKLIDSGKKGIELRQARALKKLKNASSSIFLERSRNDEAVQVHSDKIML